MTSDDNACVPSLVDAFLDGELDPAAVLRVEQHIEGCATCSERVKLNRAIKLSTQRAVRDRARPSAGFEQRLAAALAAEREREAAVDAADQVSDGRARALPWRTVAPLAAAAALAFVWAASLEHQPEDTATPRRAITARAQSMTASIDELLDELVDYHAKPASPQVTEPSLAKQFEPEVGVPVKAPARLLDYGARFEGGAVVNVKQARAAQFRYKYANHRVTVYVYDAQRVPLRARLEPRVVRDTPVFVGKRRGYSIAAVERRDVGYAVATDMNEPESAELVAAAVSGR